MVHDFIQKYGALLLSLAVAVLTIGYHNGKTERTLEEQAKRQDALEARMHNAETAGTPFSREIRNAQMYDREKIGKVEQNSDRALSLLGDQRETLATMKQQISYLIQVFGKESHKGVSFRLSPMALEQGE